MNTLEKVLRWIVIICIFALPIIPLYVANSLFFPFITGKNFAFRIIVEIMACAWLALALVSEKYRPRRNWILGTFAIFVLVIAIADAQGAYPFKSFWSNYERMDGWITIAHLLAYTVIASVMVNSEKLWRWLFQISLAISVYLSIYGLLQITGFFALGEGGASGLSARIDATFGNPIYMAVYMLFHIFIAAMLWAQMWVDRGAGKRMWPSIFYGGVIALDTIALLFTGTRGTTVGLIAGIIISSLLVVLLARQSRNAWRGAVISLLAVLVLGIGFYGVRDAVWVQKIGFLQRLATISTSDNTVKARFLNWGIAWEGIKERPILGWGQENYAIVFDKYYDARMYAQEPWFDRVHNIIFDWLVVGGFAGLIAYLSIFAATLWALWKKHHADRHVFTIAERSLLTGLLVAYFIHNFFVFDNVTSYILFGTVLAYIVWRTNDSHDHAPLIKGQVISRSALPIIVAIAIVLASGIVYEVNGRALAANSALLHGIAITTPDGLPDNLAQFKQALAYDTYGNQEAREQLVQISAQLASVNVSPEIKRQFFTLAIEQMKMQAEASPLDARFPLFLGMAEGAYGNYTDAAMALQQAHKLSPHKQTILFQIGSNAAIQNNMTAALATFKEAYELEPDNREARILYAIMLIRSSDDTAADQILTPLITSGGAADARIASAYASRNQYNKILPIWQAHIKATPDDTQAYFTLAAAAYAAGDRNQAITMLQAAKQVTPAASTQIDTFIQQVKNGTVNTK